jgi:hypothetical protein
MENITRLIPKQKHEDWPAKLSNMTSLFGEAEYQTVKMGIRKAGLFSFDSATLQEKIEDFNKDGLFFIPFRKISNSQQYSLLLNAPKEGEPFSWYGCLTKDRKITDSIKKAFLKNDHEKMGYFLGYPKCCRNYFSKEFMLNPDPVWVDLEGEVKGYPECNTLLRYFGVRMVPYMPCSPKCKETKKIGKVWFKVMKKIDKKLAVEFYDLLSKPVVWDSYHGIAQIETPYFVGITSTFNYVKKPRIIKWKALKPSSE